MLRSNCHCSTALRLRVRAATERRPPRSRLQNKIKERNQPGSNANQDGHGISRSLGAIGSSPEAGACVVPAARTVLAPQRACAVKLDPAEPFDITAFSSTLPATMALPDSTFTSPFGDPFTDPVPIAWTELNRKTVSRDAGA